MTDSAAEVPSGYHLNTQMEPRLEHMEITGLHQQSRTGGIISQWFQDKILGRNRSDGSSNNSEDSASRKPLKRMTTSNSSPARTVRDDDDDGGVGGGDYEVSSLETGRERGEIEVEIDSVGSQDDCLNRKQYFHMLTIQYKRQIILGCLFVFVFLFGVMIGACGTGQCRRGGGGGATSAIKGSNNQGLCNDNSEASGAIPGSDTSSSNGSGSSGNGNNNNNDYSKPIVENPIVNSNPLELFGENVFIFDPSMSTAEIQQMADAIFYQQQNNEMGTQRYALLFLPGVYGSVNDPLMLQIGYYTELSGLGASPMDVVVYGKIEVYNRCFEADPYQDGKFIPTNNSEEGLCFALNSFWRGLSNLSIQIVTRNQDDCRATAMFWAISQAASMRRVNIQGGDVSLMDYCSNPAYASGGFIADSKAGKIISGSQQQFITRNSHVTNFEGAAWNQVFVGVVGAPDDSTYPDPPVTTFETNPMSREKPFLYVNDAGEYFVHVPALATGSSGVTWLNGQTLGRSLPISDFFVAKPGDSVATINEQISSGKYLLLTPGVYDIAETINIDRADTVVLGFGLATLTAVNGAVPLKVASEPGIIVAGITLDGGTELSPILLQVGDLGDSDTTTGDPTNPITLSDVYFRIGGPHIGKANVCLEINSNHVLVDHTWVWRADHGVEDFDLNDGFEGDNERWVTNIGLNGVIVNGNDVTATGLFVEHYQEYNLVWNGERGRVYFFQNELPYEPPTQEEWTAGDGTLGWAAYKVSDEVQEHELWCGGAYCYNRNNPSVITTNGFEVPNREGISMNRIYTRNLSGPGAILNIINGVGQSVTDADKGPYYMVQYPEEEL